MYLPTPNHSMLTTATGGSLDNYYRTYKGYNHTITATAKKKFGDFNTRLLVGTMWQDLETTTICYLWYQFERSQSSTDSSNTTRNTRRRLLRNNSGLPNV